MNFLKEVFSAKNMKLAMLMGLLSNLNLTSRDYIYISKCVRNVRDEEVQQRKVA